MQGDVNRSSLRGPFSALLQLFQPEEIGPSDVKDMILFLMNQGWLPIPPKAPTHEKDHTPSSSEFLGPSKNPVNSAATKQAKTPSPKDHR
jgi:hypothetical protein